MRPPRRLDDCLTIQDLRELARRRLPGPLGAYLDGAAESEFTAQRNIAAFDDIQLIPKYLVDVSSVSTATRILGQDIAWPVMCSPTGATRLFHPDGELAVARAAAKAGTWYSLSSMATHSLEDVAAASEGPKIFQFFIFKDRDITRDLIARCKRAGYKALCLTIDTPVRGNCERERRSGVIPKLTLRAMANFALHPRWVLRHLLKGQLRVPIAAQHSDARGFVAQSAFLGTQFDPSVGWKDVRDFVDLWGGPFAIKGVMSADDARHAVDVGATAVFVSNHGGRQLDGAPASLEVLPDIVRAVGDQVEVILDGGVRRGVHVLKALALGAKACSIGRAYLYGLSAEGEAGVMKAFDLLRTELVRAMQLSGCSDVQRIDRSTVRRL